MTACSKTLKKQELQKREQAFVVRNPLSEAGIPAYDALTDVHCAFVESRVIYKNVLKTVKLRPEQQHVLLARVRGREGLTSRESAPSLLTRSSTSMSHHSQSGRSGTPSGLPDWATVNLHVADEDVRGALERRLHDDSSMDVAHALYSVCACVRACRKRI